MVKHVNYPIWYVCTHVSTYVCASMHAHYKSVGMCASLCVFIYVCMLMHRCACFNGRVHVQVHVPVHVLARISRLCVCASFSSALVIAYPLAKNCYIQYSMQFIPCLPFTMYKLKCTM